MSKENLISIERATELVRQSVCPPKSEGEFITLSDSLGRILAVNIYSPIHMPPFRQSAMDGYALRIGDSLQYRLIGEIKAGDAHQPSLEKGEAVRIFTGAPVPSDANTVVMQEKTREAAGYVIVETPPQPNANIRAVGEQIRKDQLALSEGSLLDAATIGLLAELGIDQITVAPKPRVAILVTGNELEPPGKPLQPGKIYESNGQMLAAALQKIPTENITVCRVKDDADSTRQTLDALIQQNDFVLVSGGISVGKYDFVGKALSELSVEEIFYKVRQKPGKPLFFGRKDHCHIFALPGNPAASLSCFYLYVWPALFYWQGVQQSPLLRFPSKAANTCTLGDNRAHLLKARLDANGLTILDGQSSAMLHTFAQANALAIIPEGKNEIKENDWLDTLLIP